MDHALLPEAKAILSQKTARKVLLRSRRTGQWRSHSEVQAPAALNSEAVPLNHARPLLTPAHSAPRLALALGGKIEMRMFSRACLAAILAVGLLNIPVFAANDTPLGMVIQAEGLAPL